MNIKDAHKQQYIIDCLKSAIAYCKNQYEDSAVDWLPTINLVGSGNMDEAEKFKLCSDWLLIMETELRCMLELVDKYHEPRTLEHVPVYANEYDITFIMEDTYDADGELASRECVGWYCGEPNINDTLLYANRELKAEYK